MQQAQAKNNNEGKRSLKKAPIVFSYIETRAKLKILWAHERASSQRSKASKLRFQTRWKAHLNWPELVGEIRWRPDVFLKFDVINFPKKEN